MRVVPIINYQNKNPQMDARNFSGKATIPRKTAAAAFLAAAISITGCVTRPAVFAVTLVPGAKSLREVNPANDKDIRTQKLIEWLMSANYIDKKTKKGVNPASFNEEEYLSFKVNNPVTENYNYRDLEKIFGMPASSLIESNGIKHGIFDSDKDKSLGLSYPNKQKLKIFIKYLPTKVQNWLTSTEAERQWL